MRLATLWLLAGLVAWPTSADAQTVGGPPPQPDVAAAADGTEPDGGPGSGLAKFLVGGALGLGMHESGHLVTSALFGGGPGVKKVAFGPLPFFAITHGEVSRAREYSISASGFWVQHATSEWLLTRRPNLRHERAPIAKGVLAFNVLTSVAYASAAFGSFGPHERDTRGMAGALGVTEPIAGGVILAPAVLDSWRYFAPGSRWAAWASRSAKVAAVVIVFAARR